MTKVRFYVIYYTLLAVRFRILHRINLTGDRNWLRFWWYERR